MLHCSLSRSFSFNCSAYLESLCPSTCTCAQLYVVSQGFGTSAAKGAHDGHRYPTMKRQTIEIFIKGQAFNLRPFQLETSPSFVPISKALQMQMSGIVPPAPPQGWVEGEFGLVRNCLCCSHLSGSSRRLSALFIFHFFHSKGAEETGFNKWQGFLFQTPFFGHRAHSLFPEGFFQGRAYPGFYHSSRNRG